FARHMFGIAAQAGQQGVGEVADFGCGFDRMLARCDRAWAHVASSARRMPENCQRAAGGKKLRYVARTCPSGVAQEPPRSTIWPHMNLPLYSATAPASGLYPG